MKLFISLILLLNILSAQNNIDFDSLQNKTSIKNNLIELRTELEDIFGDPNFSNAFWGVSIQSLKTGETVYKLNPDKLFKPASLIKLFTTSNALLLLGSRYRYHTEFYIDGDVSKGILNGNLFITGNGDPTIIIEDSFEHWIDSLNNKGIYSIKGNVIANDGNFKQDKYGEGWLAEYMENWFAPTTGAFCLNKNSIEIIIEPTQIHQPVQIRFNTEFIEDYEVINHVVTSTKNSAVDINVIRIGNNIIELIGNIPVTAEPYSVFIPVNNASQYFVNSFYEYLLDEGVEITGSALKLDEYEKNYDTNNLLLLFVNKSEPLAKIISEINKKSDNLLAEQLLKTIGYEIYGYGSTSNGIKAVKELKQGMGINPNNFIMADGSGLSSYNLITPKQVVNLLAYMYRSSEFDSFYKSLAIAGYDGTLLDRMKGTKAENNFRGKSAFLENSRGLAGYIRTADGEPLALALIVNNFLVPSQLANYIQDKVCNRLANFKRN